MSIELMLFICGFCTIAGSLLAWLDMQDIDNAPEMLNEMDWDPTDDEICRVCGFTCDDYEHWTKGG